MLNPELPHFEFIQSRPPTDRLFLAVLPTAEAGANVQALAEEVRAKYELRGRPLKSDRFHVTLHHLGDFPGLPETEVVAVRKACTSVAAAMGPFDVAFDRVKNFSQKPSRRPVVLTDGGGNHKLRELYQRLLIELRTPPPKRPFSPHVTLLYDERSVPEMVLSQPLRWTVREIVLIDSLMGQSKYVELERWELTGP